MEISRTPEYETRLRKYIAQLRKYIAQHGPFVAMQTLLGGPDRNRRTIENIWTLEKVDVLNPNMEAWTCNMQEELDARLKKLNDAYLENPERVISLVVRGESYKCK